MSTSDTWTEAVAAGYGAASTSMYAPEVRVPAADFLAALAPGGPAVEFAIGTGRAALPLSDHGITVCGIDPSSAMISQLRAEPGRDSPCACRRQHSAPC